RPLRQADLLGTHAIHVKMQGGAGHQLLYVNIDSAQYMTQAIGDLFRDEVVLRVVLAGELHINGGGLAEIQDLADNVGGLEKELDSRKIPGQFLAEPVNVLLGGLMPRFQRNEN